MHITETLSLTKQTINQALTLAPVVVAALNDPRVSAEDSAKAQAAISKCETARAIIEASFSYFVQIDGLMKTLTAQAQSEGENA